MIRAAGEADISALCALMQHIQTLHAEAHPGIFRPLLDPQRTAFFFAATLANPNNVVLVADIGGKVAGYVWCEERTTARRSTGWPGTQATSTTLLSTRRIGEAEPAVRWSPRCYQC